MLRSALAKNCRCVDVGGGETAWRIMLAMIDRDFPAAYAALALRRAPIFRKLTLAFISTWRAGRRESLLARKAIRRRLRSPSLLPVPFSKPFGIQARRSAYACVPRTGRCRVGKENSRSTEAKRAVELMPMSRDAPMMRRWCRRIKRSSMHEQALKTQRFKRAGDPFRFQVTLAMAISVMIRNGNRALPASKKFLPPSHPNLRENERAKLDGLKAVKFLESSRVEIGRPLRLVRRSTEEFSERFHRFDVRAENLEGGEQLDP